ncbi:MAG: penicillin-binding protein activator [Gammaproteobacteria bacterium]
MLFHPQIRLFPILLILSLFAGCGGSPVKEDAPPPGQIEVAIQLFDAGDYNAAAAEYLKLAKSTPATLEDDTPSFLISDYQLSAAEAYVKAGDSLKARKVIALIDRNLLDAPLNDRYHLASAKIAQLDQQPEQVIRSLDQISAEQQSQDILQMQIVAFEQLESPIEAARKRTLLDPFLGSELEQNENRQAIWKAINQQDPTVLQQLQSNSQDPLAGWGQLAIIARKSIFDADVFDREISQWRLSYPEHAAEEPILSELFKKSKTLGSKVTSIALLLPESGRFAQAGAAVRDGFLSAWYSENDQPDQPMVHVYDANAENILDVYQQAIEEGADLIVGPLEKNTLKILLSLEKLPVRTLALNQLDEQALTQFQTHIDSDHFYQFGLSPEQEARQIATKAWANGYSQALAITPEGNWGDRLFDAFKIEYEELGGIILEHQKFATSTTEYSTILSQLLNIDGSQQRFDALTKILNRKIKFEARPRKDVDFVFMAALPVHARQIRPQLLFHRASRIPVIATSHTFGLPPRGEPDLDLEGVIIGDMPWLIENQEIDPESPLSMQQNWPDDNAAFLRLFALGIDAYKVIPQLGRLRLQIGEAFVGETGNLSMNENAQIQRELAWAKFLRGKPDLINKQRSSSILTREIKESTDQ